MHLLSSTQKVLNGRLRDLLGPRGAHCGAKRSLQPRLTARASPREPFVTRRSDVICARADATSIVPTRVPNIRKQPDRPHVVKIFFMTKLWKGLDIPTTFSCAKVLKSQVPGKPTVSHSCQIDFLVWKEPVKPSISGSPTESTFIRLEHFSWRNQPNEARQFQESIPLVPCSDLAGLHKVHSGFGISARTGNFLSVVCSMTQVWSQTKASITDSGDLHTSSHLHFPAEKYAVFFHIQWLFRPPGLDSATFCSHWQPMLER